MKETKPTVATLKRIVERAGGTLEEDTPLRDCRTLQAVAPTGKQWREGVHAIRIEWARGDTAQIRAYNAAELQHVAERLRGGLVDCPADCDCREESATVTQ